jgi:phosphatidylinositol alpha-1,6-mannosyltransferase
MKICFLTNELSSKDGWSRYSVSLIEQLRKNGIDCRVLVSSTARENDLPDIKCHKILPPFGSRAGKVFSLLRNFLKIRKLIKKCDIVHSLIEPYAPIAFFLKERKPLVITLHGTYATAPFKKWYLRKIYSKVYQGAEKIISISRFTQEKFLSRVKTDKAMVINNGIDYGKFQLSKSFRKKENNHKAIISVGALKPRKGYHISIPAVAGARKRYPHLKYFIVGRRDNEKYHRRLKDLVRQYGLKDNILFLKGLSDKELINLYWQSDLFLLTPLNIGGASEGFGLVYLEAGAAKLPSIGTFGCGAEEAIKNGQSGLLVSQGDIKETEKAILRILDNPGLAEQLGQNGQKQAKEMDWSKVVEEYIEIYQTL